MPFREVCGGCLDRGSKHAAAERGMNGQRGAGMVASSSAALRQTGNALAVRKCPQPHAGALAQTNSWGGAP
jgi:hypothetical protein